MAELTKVVSAHPYVRAASIANQDDLWCVHETLKLQIWDLFGNGIFSEQTFDEYGHIGPGLIVRLNLTDRMYSMHIDNSGRGICEPKLTSQSGRCLFCLELWLKNTRRITLGF